MNDMRSSIEHTQTSDVTIEQQHGNSKQNKKRLKTKNNNIQHDDVEEAGHYASKQACKKNERKNKGKDKNYE